MCNWLNDLARFMCFFSYVIQIHTYVYSLGGTRDEYKDLDNLFFK